MIKCIAIDLDDTLLNEKLLISGANREAIRRAVGAGIKVLLASGRMVRSMRPYVEELELDLPVIAYNGAIVREVQSGKTLYHRPVPSEMALRLLPIFREAGLHLNAYLDDELYMDELTPWGDKYARNAGVTPHPVGDLAKVLTADPHKMLGVGEVEEVDRMQRRLVDEFGPVLDLVKSKPTYLEILAPGVSKGRALKELAVSWGLSRNEVMAIGDAPNDLPMITWAGVGVAIGNAVSQVKEQANHVVADNHHDGVAEAINRFVFDT